MSMHVVRPGEGTPSGRGHISATIIEDGTHTSHRISIVQIAVPVGPGSPPRHVHHEHDEIFIITRGRLRFTSENDVEDVEPGTYVIVPAGTPHTFANAFDEPAAFINTFTPDFYFHYFEDLAHLPENDSGLLDLQDVARTMARYSTEVIRL